VVATVPEELRQLGDIRRDPPRLVFGEELGSRERESDDIIHHSGEEEARGPLNEIIVTNFLGTANRLLPIIGGSKRTFC
jgi:hypothetical protein